MSQEQSEAINPNAAESVSPPIISAALSGNTTNTRPSPGRRDSDSAPGGSALEQSRVIEFRVLVDAQNASQSPARRMRLTGSRYTFGSAEGCSIRLRDDRIRPIHAVLNHHPTGITVRCYGSQIEVNGKSLSEANLQIGDVLRLGGHRFELVNREYGYPASDSQDDAVWRKRLRDEIDQWRARRETYESKRDELKRREDKLQERESAIAYRDRELEDKESFYQNRLDQAAKQLSQSRSQADAATASVARLRERFDSLNRQVETLTEDRRSWEKKQSELKREFTSQLESIRQDRDQARQAAETAEQKFHAAEQSQREAEQVRQQAEESRQQAEESRQQAEKHARDSVQRVESTLEELAEAQRQISQLDASIQALRNQENLDQDEFQEQLDQARREIAQRDEWLARRDETIETRERELGTARDGLAQCESELQAQGEALADRDQQIAERDQQIAERDEQITAFRSQIDSLENDAAQLRRSVAEAHQESAKLRKQCEATQQRIDGLLADLGHRDAEIHAAHEVNDRETDSLRQQIDELTLDLDRATAQIDRLTETNESLRRELEGIRDQSASDLFAPPASTPSFENLAEASRAVEPVEPIDSVESIDAVEPIAPMHADDSVGTLGNLAPTRGIEALGAPAFHDIEDDAPVAASNVAEPAAESSEPAAESSEPAADVWGQDTDVSEQDTDSGWPTYSTPDADPPEPASPFSTTSFDGEPSQEQDPPSHTDDPAENLNPSVWGGSAATSVWDQPDSVGSEFESTSEFGNTSEFQDVDQDDDSAAYRGDPQHNDDASQNSAPEPYEPEPFAWSSDDDASDGVTEPNAENEVQFDSRLQVDSELSGVDQANPDWKHTSNWADASSFESREDSVWAQNTPADDEMAQDEMAEGEIAQDESAGDEIVEGSLASMLIGDLDRESKDERRKHDAAPEPNAATILRPDPLGAMDEARDGEPSEHEVSSQEPNGPTRMWSHTEQADFAAGGGEDFAAADDQDAASFAAYNAAGDSEIAGGEHAEESYYGGGDDPDANPYEQESGPYEQESSAVSEDSYDAPPAEPSYETATQVFDNGEIVEDEEDSIEAYMNRLLGRVQGHGGGPSIAESVSMSAVQKSTPPPIQPSGTDSFDAPPPPDETVDHSAPIVPRSQAPEKNSDLSAMRQLANETAASAISTSVRRQAQQIRVQSVIHLGVGVACLFVGALASFIVSAPVLYVSWLMAFFAGVVSLKQAWSLWREAEQIMKRI
ncbi:MAG: FHA domain-containing protein [Planctomycetota bacterium]